MSASSAPAAGPAPRLSATDHVREQLAARIALGPDFPLIDGDRRRPYAPRHAQHDMLQQAHLDSSAARFA